MRAIVLDRRWKEWADAGVAAEMGMGWKRRDSSDAFCFAEDTAVKFELLNGFPAIEIMCASQEVATY